jgi:hypothetical protein
MRQLGAQGARCGYAAFFGFHPSVAGFRRMGWACPTQLPRSKTTGSLLLRT